MNLLEGSMEVNPLDGNVGWFELIAIAGFEGGAGQDCGLVRLMPGFDGGAEGG